MLAGDLFMALKLVVDLVESSLSSMSICPRGDLVLHFLINPGNESFFIPQGAITCIPYESTNVAELMATADVC